MLTITNQQSPNFQSRLKMGQASTKIGKYFEEKGIDTGKALLASAGLTGTAGTVMLASPNAVSAPDAAKWMLGGGMASTFGLMSFMNSKTKTTEKNADAKFIAETRPDFAESVKTAEGMRLQKRTVLTTIEENQEVADLDLISKPGFAEIDSPIGKMALSQDGIKQYLEIAKLYSEGKPNEKRYSSDAGKVIEAILSMEVLGSLGEFSTKYNNVIKSKTFGKINVTDNGLQQYLGAIKLYAGGKPNEKRYSSDASKVIEAENIINVIKGNGEF